MNAKKPLQKPVIDDWRADWRRASHLGLTIGIVMMLSMGGFVWMTLLLRSYWLNQPLLPEMRPGEERAVIASWVFIILFGVAAGVVVTTVLTMLGRSNTEK